MPHRRHVVSGLASAALLAPEASAMTLDLTQGFTGRPGDFDFLKGRWAVRHRTLKREGGWREFDGAAEFRTLMEGVANIDENRMPGGAMGVTFRTLDVRNARWSIYWVSSASGLLQPPVHGGFKDGRGEFYGEDVDQGRPILARYVWLPGHPGGPHWEQAYSLDHGKTWETNWTMDFRPA